MSEQTEQDGVTRAPERPPRRPHGPMGMSLGGEKATDFRGTMKKLLHFMGKYKIALVIVVIFALGSTVFNIIGPKVLSTATTELFEGITAKIAGTGGINFDAVGVILLTTLILYAVSAACSFAQGWIMTRVVQGTCFELRRRIAAKIDALPVGYFEKTSTGDVLSRITNDVDTLGMNLNASVTQLITGVATVLGVVIMMLSISPIMTLVALIIIPVSLLIVSVVVKRSQKYFRMQQNRLGAINGQVEETFSGHAVVRAFGKEDEVVEKFRQTNEELRESAWKSQFLSGLLMPIMTFVSNLGYVVVAVVGALFAIQGRITVGDIQAFIQYMKNFTQPLTQLAQISNVLQQMAAAAERVFEFLDAEEEKDEPAKILAAEVKDNVEFVHVSFSYEPGKPVITDFSASVKEGQTVAIVGPTGAGKTTMVKLLMRYYDVDSGAIRIGGHDVREFDRNDLRSMVWFCRIRGFLKGLFVRTFATAILRQPMSRLKLQQKQHLRIILFVRFREATKWRLMKMQAILAKVSVNCSLLHGLFWRIGVCLYWMKRRVRLTQERKS